MQRVKLSLACLLSLAWVWPVMAQTAMEADPGIATVQQFSGGATFAGTYFDIRHQSGDGVGYQNGYTSFGAFLPVWIGDNAYWAPTARLIVTDNNQAGANGGLVFRRYLEDYDRIFGANVFYDYDRSIEGFDYTQFGFGFESLGERLDFRSNVYLPREDGNNFIRPLRLGNDAYFFGNRIGFLGVGQFQEAVSGGDFEVGTPLSRQTPWLRGFLGAYYYDSQGEDPIGVRGRIEANISDDLTVGVNVTEDRAFGTNVNAVVDWRFAGWKSTRYFPQWTTRERMLTQVQRNWRIATNYYESDVNVQAVNPATNRPYFVTWIDNSNTAPGSGTFEDPFATLVDQAPGSDLILVRKGNTSSIAPLAGSIALFDGQRLLGEGRAHQFAASVDFAGVGFNGVYTLPGFVDDPSQYPWLTSAANTVTLADSNEVSAFNLVNANGNAITNTPSGSWGFDLNHLNITGNGGGIFLSDAGGRGFITDVNAINNTAGGIYLDSGASPLRLTMQNVTASRLLGGSQGVGVSINADQGSILADATNVNANRNGTGMILSASNNASLDIVLRDVNVNDSIGTGVRINGNFGRLNINAANMSVNRSGGPGVQAVADNTYFTLQTNGFLANQSGLDNMNLQLSNSTMDVRLQNSTFNNSAAGSGVVVNNSAGGGTLVLDNVTATGNALDGLGIGVSTFAEVDAAVSNAVLGSNGRDAISLTGTTGGELNLLQRTTFAGNSGRDGLHFDFQSDSVLTADLRFLTLTNSGRSAVYGLLDNATADLVLDRFSGANSGADGLFLSALNDSLATISLSNGNLSNSGQTVDPSAAIQIVSDNSDVALQVVNTPLNNTTPGGTQDDGLNVVANNFSNVLINLSGADLSNNSDNALELISANNSRLTVGLLNSNGTDSGNDGILFQSLNNSFLSLSATASNFDRSGGNGINGYVNNTSTATFNFSQSSVANSGLNGMVIRADNQSAFLSSFSLGSFANSGQNGAGLGFQDAINVAGNDFSTIAINLQSTPTSNIPANATQQHGLFANMSNGSGLFFTNTGGDMANNLLNALDITLTSGSSGLIVLQDTLANNSGEDGFLFNVDASLLQASVTNGSFSDSGAGGVTGSAVNGTITNGGTAIIDFVNVTSNNALDHGMIITAVDSRFVGRFDPSPFDNAGSPGGVPTRATNAVQLNADNSVMDLTMIDASTGDNAGGDALVINAINNSFVTGTFIDGSFSNAGQVTGVGAAVNVTSDNSFVALSFENTPTTNTNGNTTQAYGLLYDIVNGSDLFVTVTDGDLNLNTISGIQGSIDNGSAATITLDNTLVEFNGFFGALFDVANGSTLNFNIPNGSSISRNGSFGVLASVDGAPSQANFNFVDVDIDENGLLFGGDGFNAAAINGAVINASFTRGSISSNADQGVEAIVNTGGVANYQFLGTTVEDNGLEGLRMDLDDAASQLIVTAVNASFSNNGTFGNTDNINAQITGGFFDGAFVGTSANASTRSGYNFDISDATGPTSVVLHLAQGTDADGDVVASTASQNAEGNGIRFVGTGPTTSMNLIMTGTNEFNENGTSVGVGVPGSGVYFEADNVLQSTIRFSGSASNNGTAAALPADQDGVTVDVDTATFAAVEILGPGNISNNQGDGIDVNLVDVANLQDRTLFTQLGPELVRALNIGQSLTVSENGGAGVSVIVDGGAGGTVFTGDIVFDGITAGTNGGGPGLLLDLTNVSGTPNLTISNNQIGEATGDGVRLLFDNAPLNRVNILNNQIGLVLGGGGGTAIDDSLPVIRTGFNQNTLAPNDDGSTGSVNPGFSLNFFGQVFNNLFVNNNGNVTFNNPLGTFTPFPIVNNGVPMLAPFFADVDTRSHGQPVTFGTGTIAGRNAFAVNWVDVDYFSSNPAHGTQLNDFQLVLIDRSDIAAGDFDMEFNYGNILWETGNASGGTNGLGGNSARAGFTNGVANSFEFAGSGVNGAFLNNGPAATSLINNRLVSNNNGRYIFFARSGGFGGGASGNSGDGIHIEQVNSSFNELVIDGNAITDNGGDGIDFAVVQNSNLVAPGQTVYITNNQITGNTGGDGVRLVNPITVDTNLNIAFLNNEIGGNGGNGVNLQTTAPITTLNARFDNNLINANTAGRGVNLVTNTAATILSDITNNRIVENATDGMNIQLTAGSRFISEEFWGNTISGNGTSGIGMGVRLNGPGGAVNPQIVWNIGDSNQAQNVIGVDEDGNGNRDAGIGIDLRTNSQAVLRVQNTIFTGTDNGTDALFDGDGLAIRAIDQANISGMVVGTGVGSTRNTLFTNNESDGMSIFLSGSAQMSNPGFFNIGATGNGTGAGVTDGRGLRITREGLALVDNVLVAGSSFDSNDEGVTLVAAAAPSVDEYTILDNTFNTNTGRGMHLRVEADATMLVNIQGNEIVGNGTNALAANRQGIHVSEDANAPADIRSFEGFIRDNLITNNGTDGIEISAQHGLNVPLVITQNVISNNLADGIEINRLGTNTISLNTIADNGGSGININAGNNISLGVDFGGTTTSTIVNNLLDGNNKGIELVTGINDTNVTTVQGNTIINSTLDGVEIVNDGGSFAGQILIGGAAANQINTIADNGVGTGGRGIDILNRQFGFLNVAIQGNNILRNGGEGVYVVNTPTFDQASDVASNVAMQTTTNTTAGGIMILTADANQIRDNGSSSTFDSTGLVIRVGTSDAFSFLGSFSDDGGFATNGAGGNGVFDTGDLTFRSGVAANVTNNQFSGQFGNDVSFQSFVGVSTTGSSAFGLGGTLGEITPSAGAWTDGNENPRNNANDTFDTDTFVQDPLARLDLIFTGNTGLSLNVTRQGAAYNNDEPLFKSRTAAQDNGTDGGLDDNGPFSSGTRRRNAQRLAARNVADFPAGGQLPPLLTIVGTGGTPGTSDDFLFSGMGESTFRVTGTSNTAGFSLGDTFLLDNTPFNQTSLDSSGDFFPGANIFGENPFGWSVIP
jgi:trimeric autotransporter adhesin